MEKLILSEQEIINAVCVYASQKQQANPEDVEVELFYDDEEGFSAEAYIRGQKQELLMSHLIEAIRLWLEEYLGRDPYVGIKLMFDENEGIIAHIR